VPQPEIPGHPVLRGFWLGMATAGLMR